MSILLLKRVDCLLYYLKPLRLLSLILLELTLFKTRMKYYYCPIDRCSVSLIEVVIHLLLAEIDVR
jgi:hypothetical protein